MIVSTVRLAKFDDDSSKKVIGALTRASTDIEPDPPKGFLHSMLLRPEDGSGEAILFTMWESQADLGQFMASDQGAEFVKKLADVLGAEARDRRNHYFVTWQSEIYQPRPTQACGCHESRRT